MRIVSPRSTAFPFVGPLAAALLGLSCLVGCDGGGSNGATGVGPDRDRDGVADTVDNCPDDVNALQFDSDNDGHGNVCDNCPNIANADQEDLDLDGIGDACQGGDQDGDTVADLFDNCLLTPNPTQADNDSDGIGDACDSDLDNDGLPNDIDPDRDGDGVANESDASPDDRFACRDRDGDDCDDCSSGTDNMANDGFDSDGDGFCDAGLATALVRVGVTSPTPVFGVQVSVIYDRSRMTIAGVDAANGLGPYDESNYLPPAPGIVVEYFLPADNRVNVQATFTTFSPDPSFVAPADVVGLSFLYGPVTPTMLDFGILACEAVDAASDVIVGATCDITGVDLDQ